MGLMRLCFAQCAWLGAGAWGWALGLLGYAQLHLVTGGGAPLRPRGWGAKDEREIGKVNRRRALVVSSSCPGVVGKVWILGGCEMRESMRQLERFWAQPVLQSSWTSWERGESLTWRDDVRRGCQLRPGYQFYQVKVGVGIGIGAAVSALGFCIRNSVGDAGTGVGAGASAGAVRSVGFVIV